MGFDMHVYGIVPADAEYKRMQAVWEACEKANVPVPREVEVFFNYDKPDGHGIQVALGASEGVAKLPGDSGYVVRIDQLPKNVKAVKFLLSC
jgi:hypothetical protein